jgi:hypothetical protein
MTQTETTSLPAPPPPMTLGATECAFLNALSPAERAKFEAWAIRFEFGEHMPIAQAEARAFEIVCRGA